MKREEIINSIKRDILSFEYTATIETLTNNRAIAARDVFLPMIEKMDDDWLMGNWDIDIYRIAVLENGIPSMRRVNRFYPELLK